MKVVVDSDACIGCGLCVETCPEVYDLDEGIAIVLVKAVPFEHQEAAREAAGICPVDALTIEE